MPCLLMLLMFMILKLPTALTPSAITVVIVLEIYQWLQWRVSHLKKVIIQAPGPWPISPVRFNY